MTFTAEQVVEALKDSKVGGRGEYADDYDDEDFIAWDEIYGTDLETPIGAVKLIEDVGGEGQGDHAHVVIQTVATGQFFRIDGYYSSYDGTNWDDGELYEVRPITKTVVVYE